MIAQASSVQLVAQITVPYLGLLAFGPKAGPRAALFSSLGGFLGSIAWYAAAYASTSKGLTGLAAPGILGAIHPIIPGILASVAIFALCAKRVRVEAEAGAEA